MASMNDWIRAAAGRGQPQQEQPGQQGPTERVIQDYAAMVGCTRTEALQALTQQPTPTPPGNAGAGTQQPPARKATMNDLIRQAISRRTGRL